MSTLIVRNVDEALISALKERAARHGRSVEAEHRALLSEVLLQPRPSSGAPVSRLNYSPPSPTGAGASLVIRVKSAS